MTRDFTLADLRTEWDSFFREYHQGDLDLIANEYPDRRSLLIDYRDVTRFNTDLASYLLDYPERVLHQARLALRANLPPDAKVPVHVRVHHLPTSARREIRHLRAEHVGAFVAIEGIVRRATEVRPRIVEAAFKCVRCGHISLIPQEDGFFREPLECDKTDAGCGRTSASTRWDLITELPPDAVATGAAALPMSTFLDTQRIETQESPENMRGGEQPRRLWMALTDDITGSLNPGDRVIVSGVLKSRQKGRPSAKSTDFDLYLSINSFEHQEVEFEEVEVTPEEEAQIVELSRDPHIYDRIVRSIAPSIFGLLTEKEAVMLQLFGGVPKQAEEGVRMRGDIHILLVGDPGVAKSQLLSHIAKLAPRGIYTSGKGASAAGLTAAAVHGDEFGEGRWTLEAGALVLGDKGMVCIDELDKMSDTDRESIHTAMEQQTVNIAKAGIHATLHSRCSILAAANPKFGRFDDRSTLPEQLELDPALISRFDVIFTITDRPEVTRDTSMAEFIVRQHLKGEIRTYQAYSYDDQYDERLASLQTTREVPIDRELLRKYLAHAKRNTFPVMEDAAHEKIVTFYVTMRAQGAEGTIPLTARQIEAVIRLSEASARVRLSQVVTLADVDRAIRIIDYFLRRFAMSEGGTIDMAIVTTGHSQVDHDRRRSLLRIIEELQGSEGAHLDDIVQRAQEQNLAGGKFDELLSNLAREGSIYSPRKDRYRVT